MSYYKPHPIDVHKTVYFFTCFFSVLAAISYSAGVLLLYRVCKFYLWFAYAFYMVFCLLGRQQFQLKFAVVALVTVWTLDFCCCLLYRLIPPLAVICWPLLHLLLLSTLARVVRQCDSSCSSLIILCDTLKELLRLLFTALTSCASYIGSRPAAIKGWTVSYINCVLASLSESKKKKKKKHGKL